MSYLSKEDILKADDLAAEDVEVPEWGGTVRVRALSGTDRDAYQASLMQVQANGQAAFELSNMTTKLVARSLVDADGNPLFTELDIGQLAQKSGVALQRVFDVAARLSAINQSGVEVATANFVSGPTDDSTSP